MAQLRDVGLYSAGGALVGLFGREFDELPRVGEAPRETVEAADDVLELRAFLAEFLRALRLVPDAGLL